MMTQSADLTPRPKKALLAKPTPAQSPCAAVMACCITLHIPLELVSRLPALQLLREIRLLCLLLVQQLLSLLFVQQLDHHEYRPRHLSRRETKINWIGLRIWTSIHRLSSSYYFVCSSIIACMEPVSIICFTVLHTFAQYIRDTWCYDTWCLLLW